MTEFELNDLGLAGVSERIYEAVWGYGEPLTTNELEALVQHLQNRLGNYWTGGIKRSRSAAKDAAYNLLIRDAICVGREELARRQASGA
ncbi:MAG: hypothetical protein KC492_13475 [Myxococcales bacterium]|nr:hypothetical protein [Myxococcales bacterium]